MSMIGKSLAHYEITGSIGKGGMGEVYRARDRTLGRDVAVKVLPGEFAGAADRIARLRREATILASLNHPNIAAVYGLEESGGTSFLVMELVEGGTLQSRLLRGPVPVGEALKLALQIAEALEAAHGKGVIHRDLKPANIAVTPDGRVKVLDFGLAKALAPEQEGSNLSASPTLSGAATREGVILGTAAYMSPEQARGEAVDRKADIWAFGSVLFEMLSGTPPFEGRTVTDVLASVLKTDPDWRRLPPGLHPRVRPLLERCLEKDAADRSGSIGDARVDLRKALSDPAGVTAPPAASARWRRGLLPWVAAAAILGALAGAVAWSLRAPEPRRGLRFEDRLPQGQRFRDSAGPAFAVSPDGRQFVYGEMNGLYLRAFDAWTATLIAGTEGSARLPFFSPDGRWVGYWTGTQLRKIAVGGGVPESLCDTQTFYGAQWQADGTIVCGTLGGILRVPPGGGTPEFLIEGASAFVAPQILPGGRAVLFTDAAARPGKVVAQALGSGERRELFAGSAGRYLRTGHIVYASGNTLLAVPFDPGRLEITGEPVSVIEGVYNTAGPLFAVSEAGTLAYAPGAAAAPPAGRTLAWVDQNGKEEEIPAPRMEYMFPKISPDGTRVALTLAGLASTDIWVWDFGRETLTRLTFDVGQGSVCPLWTPDGKTIVYGAVRDGNKADLYCKPADGTGKEEKLFELPDRSIVPYSMAPNGKALIASDVEGNLMASLKWDIGTVSLEGGPAWKTLLREEYVETQPQLSPDGRWLAYHSNEAETRSVGQIYVRPFPDVDAGKWQVTPAGGSCPRWSPDGKELLYLSGENSMMAVSVETGPDLRLGTPRTLFRSAYVGLSLGIPWDIHPDGGRFLMMKESAAAAPAEGGPREINFVLDWFEELRQRVPRR